jgi:hypothetical protein
VAARRANAAGRLKPRAPNQALVDRVAQRDPDAARIAEVARRVNPAINVFSALTT